MSSPNVPRPRSVDRPRYRYLLVRSSAAPAPTRETVLRSLQTVAPRELGLWLTRYEEGVGIIRVPRELSAKARAFLGASKALDLTPILTSGSIAGLQRKRVEARRLRQTRR
jgi:RNase P/RNase MRP subunit POP5